MKKRIILYVVFLVLTLMFSPFAVIADDWYDNELGYYSILDDAGKELTMMAREILVKDEYITSDNKHYVVDKIDKEKKQAHTKFLGTISLPEVEIADAAMEALALPRGNVLIYATHTDESYVPSDGTESKETGGGILDVAKAFQSALKDRGVKAIFDATHHMPHDAGAYRRSRVTALKLIKQNMPVAAIFDIHRDAVPKEHYETKVDGQYMTKVRIVLGKRNQNFGVNRDLAYRIKAIADKAYPGLVKDIFIGQGAYNQELSPRSLLFEVGTHENTKENAEKGARYMADVVTKSMAGGTVSKKSSEGKKQGEFTTKPISQQSTRGSSKGIIWVIALVVIGGIGFAFISSGGREVFKKASNMTRQEFSSFLGRRKRK